MSIFSQLLEQENSFFDKFYKNEKVDMLIKQGTSQQQEQCKQFHLDCSLSKRKICTCQYYEDNLMPQKEKKIKQSMVNYLQNKYNGILDEDYKLAFRKKQLILEKIKGFQEIDDMFYYMPKFKHVNSNQLLNDKFLQQQMETREEQKQPMSECYHCKTQNSRRFYSAKKIISEGNEQELEVCHDCAKVLHPELVPKPPNFWRRGRKPQMKKKEDAKDEKKIPSNLKCHWQSCENKINQEDLLVCKDCETAYHAKCCEPPLNYKMVIRFNNWSCNECKLCDKCQKTTDENKLLICDCCDRAFHLQCLVPKRSEVPVKEWFCKDCDKCVGCKKRFHQQTLTPEQLDKLGNQVFQQCLLCEECYNLFQNGQYCPICFVVIPDDDDNGGDFIYCDFCELWVHAECERINKYQMKNVINQLDKYKCSKCKEKQMAELALQAGGQPQPQLSQQSQNEEQML